MTHSSTSRAGAARRWGARSLLAAMLLSLLLPGVAAAGNGAAVVRGTQLAYGTCGDLDDGYVMTGDLNGCWWITDFQSTTPDSHHNVRATGTELFVGWVGSRYGSFTTTFQYTAKMEGSWENFLEIHGRCHHPIVADSGTGDLAGITGELSFKDVVDVVPNYYPYWGSVRIAGQTLTLSQLATTKSSSSTTSSVSSPC